MKRILYSFLVFIIVGNVFSANENTVVTSSEIEKDSIVKDSKNQVYHYATYTPHTRHYFNINLGAGLGSYLKSTDLKSYGGSLSSKLGVGQMFQVEYEYFFAKNWGIGVGVGIAHLNSSITGDCFRNETRSGSYDIDYEIAHHRLTNFKEVQDVINLKVPLQVHFRTRVNYQSSFHIGLGVAFDMPMYSRYKYKGGVYDITLDEYQNGQCVTEGKPFVSYGRSEIDQIMGVRNVDFYGRDGKFKLQHYGCDVLADIGFLYNSSRTFGIYFGLYASYGMLDSKCDKVDDKEFMFDMTNDTYKGVCETKLVSKLHSIEAGVKIGFDFCLRNKEERYELHYLEEESQRIAIEQQRVADSLQEVLRAVREGYSKLDYIDSVEDFRKSLFVSTQTDVKMMIYAIDNDTTFIEQNNEALENGTYQTSVALFKQNVFDLGESKFNLQYELDDISAEYALQRSSKIALRYYKGLLNARNTAIVRYCLLDVNARDSRNNLRKEYVDKSNAVVNDFLDNGISSTQLEMVLPQADQKQEDGLNAIFRVFDYGICSPLSAIAFYFDSEDNLIISDATAAELAALIKRIGKMTGIRFNIVGNYCGSRLYTECYTKALRRAEALKEELVRRGVSAKSIACYSRANKAPIAKDKNNEYRNTLNNRLDIEVYRVSK